MQGSGAPARRDTDASIRDSEFTKETVLESMKSAVDNRQSDVFKSAVNLQNSNQQQMKAYEKAPDTDHLVSESDREQTKIPSAAADSQSNSRVEYLKKQV